MIQQTTHAPDRPPVIPLMRWPAGSPKRRLLEDLLTTLAALQAGSQNHLSQAEAGKFISLHLTRFIHNSHQFTKYVQAVQSQDVPVAQQVHMRRDGSKFNVELSGSVYRYQDCSYLLCVVRDVSQRVHADDTLALSGPQLLEQAIPRDLSR